MRKAGEDSHVSKQFDSITLKPKSKLTYLYFNRHFSCKGIVIAGKN